jgi:hypothetical protein
LGCPSQVAGSGRLGRTLLMRQRMLLVAADIPITALNGIYAKSCGREQRIAVARVQARAPFAPRFKESLHLSPNEINSSVWTFTSMQAMQEGSTP